MFSNNYLLKSANEAQSDLSLFFLYSLGITFFFIWTIVFSGGYMIKSPGIVHYMGEKKNKAEIFAFLFSSFALLVMFYPSMKFLYEFSICTTMGLTVKIVGAQWYWTYEMSNFMEEESYMYMLPLDELEMSNYRSTEVDNRLVAPSGIFTYFHVTSSDVIHSFAIPTLGVKIDAISGVLSVVSAKTTKVGTHYGQCSEICGMNHAFMPFCLEVSTMPSFFYWILSMIEE